MKVIHHPDCLLHNPPYEILSGKFVPYLESPDRLRIILNALRDAGDASDDVGKAKEVFEIVEDADENIDVEKAILKVHTEEYLEYMKGAYEKWVEGGGDKTAVFPETMPHPAVLKHLESQPRRKETLNEIANAGLYCFDLSCPITADTYKATLTSVRVALSAASQLPMLSETDGIFALCRPPGHHAAEAVCGGYCFFNNVAIAARYIQDRFPREELSYRRPIAILDIDYHHGNGTQSIFYEDDTVFYVSLHAEDDYPYFTGRKYETGIGAGLNHNLNIPIPKGSSVDTYMKNLDHAVECIQAYGPDFLLVSLGVDTYIDDPICQFKITTEAYKEIGRYISRVKRPTLFVMEGGYNMEAIGANVRNVLLGFEGK